MIRPVILLLIALVVPTYGFCGVGPSSKFLRSKTHLQMSMIPPAFKGKDYDRVVENIMRTKGLTREEAEKDYNDYLDNPNNYALNKVSELAKHERRMHKCLQAV